MAPKESTSEYNSCNPSLNALQQELAQAEQTYNDQRQAFEELEATATQIKSNPQHKPKPQAQPISFKKSQANPHPSIQP